MRRRPPSQGLATPCQRVLGLWEVSSSSTRQSMLLARQERLSAGLRGPLRRVAAEVGAAVGAAVASRGLAVLS